MDAMEYRAGTQAEDGRRGNVAVKFIILLTVCILLLITGFVLSYRFVLQSLVQKEKEVAIEIAPEKGIPIEIPMGSSTDKITGILKEKSLIKYPVLFKLLSKFNGYDGMYKSGTHIVSSELDYEELMRVLTDKPVSVRVTIPEGYTFSRIKEEFFNKKLIDKAKFDEVAKVEKYDFKYLENVNRSQNLLEGYLFPDTYEFDLKAGEKTIITLMLKNFDDKFKPEYYKRVEELKKEYGVTVDKVITLASIIERETRLPEERKIVAGIFYNRLTGKARGVPKRLESCATLQYVYLERTADKTPEDAKKRIANGVITEEDKKSNDPYNTYRFEGLPPGPICSPGKAAIEAALYPESTDYNYFVARGDGSNQFSRTLAEHTAAMQKYNKILK